jgi:hypothetical protein
MMSISAGPAERGPVRLQRGRPMPRMRVLMRPAVWSVYVAIAFEILFMISPFTLHFYAANGPLLNVSTRVIGPRCVGGYRPPNHRLPLTPASGRD